MNISNAAKVSGLSAKTIRYYESIGLVDPAKRSSNGYRDYAVDDVQQLQFLQRSRSSGFSIEESRQLLALYQQPQRHSADVKALVESKVIQLDQQLTQLQSMRDTLIDLAQKCPGDETAQCTILNRLAQTEGHDNE